MQGVKLTVVTCLDCGIEFTAKHPRCKRCPVCRPLWRKELARIAKKKFEGNKERYNAHARVYARKQALKNPEKYKAKNSQNARNKKLQRQQNPEKAQATKAYMAKYFQENKERAVARNKQWIKEHPEQSEEIQSRSRHNRRARLAGVQGTWSYKEFAKLCVASDNHCYYCHKQCGKLTADHMIPIARKGPNTIDNIVPVCLSCNCSKRHKTLLEFMPNIVRMGRQQYDDHVILESVTG